MKIYSFTRPELDYFGAKPVSEEEHNKITGTNG